MKKILLTAVAALLFATGASAQAGLLKKNPAFNIQKGMATLRAPQQAIETDATHQWWGYVQDNAYRTSLGTQKAETVNQCILVKKDNTVVVGNTIKAVRFYLRSTSDIKDVKLWISTNLPATADKANVLVQDLDINTLVGGDEGENYMGMLNEVELDQPYTMGNRNIYVGYSYTVTSVAQSSGQYPVVLSYEDGPAGSLYLSTSSIQWQTANSYGPLALRILVEGEFPENSVSPASPGEVFAALNSEGTADVTLTNLGTAGINNFDYTITSGSDVSEEYHINLAEPFTTFGGKANIKIPVQADAEVGTVEKTLTITKVNGKENEAANNSATFYLTTLSKIVPRGIAVEEFTGTGCGWCPRGLVGMEKMRKEFGDTFVGIGIHMYNSSDPMYISAYNQVDFSGAPSCRINRGPEIDPYYGSGNDVFDDFRAAMAIPAKASVAVSGEWNADSTKVTAKAEIEAIVDGEYVIEYVLIADSLTGTTNAWKQSNYYYQYSPEQLPADLAFLPGLGSSYFTVFNDVAIAVAKQTQTTAPGKLTSGQVVENTYTLSMPTKAALKEAIIKDKVAVVALLIDKNSKTIVNAAKFYMPASAPEPEILEQTIDVAREVGMGYNVTVGSVDFTEAKAYLGTDQLTTSMLSFVNPDGSEIAYADYQTANYDGWCNEEGAAENWGSTTKICVKFFQAIPDGQFQICDMNGADVPGKTYSVKWALKNGEKTVLYTINVTFNKPEVKELEIVDKGIATKVAYDVAEGDYVYKETTITDDQVAAICQELGISTLTEATIYGYNPTTKELVKNHAGYDGWRDANGDFHNWNADGSQAPACVKIIEGDKGDGGKTYYCYNRAGQNPQTIKCYWALANDEKAVLVEIDFIYKGADDPEPAVPDGWTSVITNGNMAGDDVSCFFSKEQGVSADPIPSTIVEGAGKGGSRGIVVQSADNPSQDWDTQFFIRAIEALPVDTKIHVEFDYKADKDADADTQAHGEPGAYKYWACVGSPHFTSEWQHLTFDGTVTGDMADMQTIAFNLSKTKEAVQYVFDNIVFWIQKPKPVNDWNDLLVNGNMEGTEVVNFFSKEYPSAEIVPSRIVDGAGKDGSRGIEVDVAARVNEDWDSQFWIYLPTTLPEGTKYKVEFDYRADNNVTVDTQAHAEPGSYIWWSMIGSPAFTTEWQHYVKEGTISADQAGDGTFRSVAFNLSKNSDTAVKFFFDNVKFMIEKEAVADDPEPAVPDGWTSVIVNGNMASDDVSCFFSKEQGVSADPVPSTIVEGAGLNGSRGIVVQSADNPSQDWDTQFFIRATKTLPVNTKIHVEFDYKADKDADADTQAHGEPGAYKYWACIGSPHFTSEWQHHSYDTTVSGDMADMQTIAFNLSKTKEAVQYVFDNIVFWVQEPAPVDEWADLLVNGNMEGTEVVNFFSKEAPSAEILPSRIFDGMGVDGSRGIKVESASGAAQDWDSQFWIYLPTTLPEGTTYKVEFDYRADRDASADTQAHAEPGSYIWWSMIGSPAFTTEWQHYKKEGAVSADQAGDGTFRSIAFNLSKDKENAVTFFFDNIKFLVEKSWYETGIRTINDKVDSESIYNLRGQQVQNPSKGLYIINGKKVVIK